MDTILMTKNQQEEIEYLSNKIIRTIEENDLLLKWNKALKEENYLLRRDMIDAPKGWTIFVFGLLTAALIWQTIIVFTGNN
jgi:hypothetical protein